MVEKFGYGRDNGGSPVHSQSGENVQEAMDMMIDATLKIMEEVGGEASKPDKGHVLHDLVGMFDDRLAQAEAEEQASPERIAALGVARDRALERYERETGLDWARRTE